MLFGICFFVVRCLLRVVCSPLVSLCCLMCVFAMCVDVRSVLFAVCRVVRVVRRYARCPLFVVCCWLMYVVGCCLMWVVCCVVFIIGCCSLGAV